MPANTSDNLKFTAWLTLLFFLMLTVNADAVLYSWFDEGWTLTVARNWVEQGQYALRLDDQWVSAETMTQSFTVTAPIAASFKLFGINLITGRLPGMLYTIGMFTWMFLIARHLYGVRVAWGTILTALLLAPSPELQPFIVGRQALGEIPMLFFLLSGYWCLQKALHQPRISLALLGTTFLWGLALITKLQPFPFWFLAVALPLALALKNRDYPTAKKFALLLLGTGGFTALFYFIENRLLDSAPLYGPPVSTAYLLSLIWNTNPTVRLETALTFIGVGFFPVLGIVHFLKRNRQIIKTETHLPPTIWLEFSLWTLICSWNLWYLIASWGFQRYHLPAYLISWIFFAKALHDLTAGFNWQKTLKTLSPVASPTWQSRAPQLGMTLLLAVLFAGFWVNTTDLISRLTAKDQSLYSLTDYIHTHIAPTALIETYESEILFLLPDRRIHFPPHQTQEELNRRTFQGENLSITYDPLHADPDIIILGNFTKGWRLYDPVLPSNFKLIMQIGQYDLYQRIR